MRNTILALTVASALVFMATPVVAHDFGVGPYWVSPNPEHAPDDPVTYAESAAIYEETNGVEGLQRCPTTDDNGRPIEADTLVAGAEPECGA